MDLTLNIKLYHTKKLFEVNPHDIRKNITLKNGSPLFKIFDPKHGHVEFFQNLREHVPVGYSGFYYHFLFNFSWRFFTYT